MSLFTLLYLLLMCLYVIYNMCVCFFWGVWGDPRITYSLNLGNVTVSKWPCKMPCSSETGEGWWHKQRDWCSYACGLSCAQFESCPWHPLSSRRFFFVYLTPSIQVSLQYLNIRGTAVAQWLRCCATDRKVAGSIPDGVIRIFHWHNPSDRAMARGSSQPITEMSTRNISWG